jgi:hypothetical protein
VRERSRFDTSMVYGWSWLDTGLGSFAYERVRGLDWIEWNEIMDCMV